MVINMSVLQVQNITKIFPGTVALDDVSITFESGRVNALVGKNGSGKSTLVKIINGAQPTTSGKILIDGEEMHFLGPKDAFNKSITTVYQELSLIPGWTVAENILMGRYKMKGKLIDWEKSYEMADEILNEMGIDMNSQEMVYKLSIWERQLLEIVKAVNHNPKVILLDEPTSSLTQKESQMLFKLVMELKKRDVVIIYITHRLQELWEIADTCTVLKDGKCTGNIEMKNATHKQILDLMFGDVVIKHRPKNLEPSDQVVLKVNNLTREPAFKNVSFELKKGEILGIAGMLGSGRTELLRAIFGADQFDRGEIIVEQENIKFPSPIKMKEMGLALTPEDRKNEGLIQVMSVKNNLCNASLKLLSRGIFINRKLEIEFANRQVENLQIKTPDINFQVTSLSGGNQQKIVIGNWLNTSPKVILFDEPSRGIDVDAKQQIFQIIWELSRKGISSILVSSELEELLEVCHRILIMRHGQITGVIRPEALKIDDLYSRCMGGNAF